MSYKKKQSGLRKKLLIVVVSMSVLLPHTARASECTDVVKACDKALQDQDQVINLKTATIKAQSEVIGALDTKVIALEKDKNSIFNNPWLYFGLGVLTGTFLLRK